MLSTIQRCSPRRTKFGDLRYPDLEVISKKKKKFKSDNVIISNKLTNSISLFIFVIRINVLLHKSI